MENIWKPRRGQEDNIEMDFMEVGGECACRIILVQDRWIVRTVLDSLKAGYFLNSRATVGLSGRTPFHGVR